MSSNGLGKYNYFNTTMMVKDYMSRDDAHALKTMYNYFHIQNLQKCNIIERFNYQHNMYVSMEIIYIVR